MIIGISGYARSGKDTAAEVLVEEYGFKRVAFADKLRDFLYALDPLVNPGHERYFSGPKGPVTLQELFSGGDINWDNYKETHYGPEIRRLLQRLGTEAGRDVLGDTIWIDAALNNLDPEKNYVLTDVRFLNEAGAVRERGGKVWRITRAGVGPANNHASETSLDDYPFDLEIKNDDTLENYHSKVDAAYQFTTIGMYHLP